MAKLSRSQEKAIDQMVKIAQEATKKIAEEVTFKLEIAYEKSIDAFYSDYKPRYYKRTNSTYYASNGFKYGEIFKAIKKNKRGYLAGISVSSSNILGDPYRAETDWVFERTFAEGIHGMTPEEVSEATWLKENSITPYYRYPLFSKGKRLWHKRPMQPTPKERMDKAYRIIYSELDKISKKEMDEAYGRYS